MKTKTKEAVMTPLSTYVRPIHKKWLASQAKKKGLKLYEFLEIVLSSSRGRTRAQDRVR